VIRLEHQSLPVGLSAVARRGERGDLTIVVSESLDAAHRRAAVRAALLAARRHDRRLALLPLPALIFMSASRSALRKLGHLLRAHAVATAVAATATAGAVAAGVLIIAMPASHMPLGAGLPGPPGYQLSPGASSPATPGRAHARTRTGAPTPSHAGTTGVVVAVSPSASPQPSPSPQPSASAQPSPSASSSSPTRGPTPGPSPSHSTATPQPSPTPSSSPSGGSGGGGCLRILGIVVCL
jgi:hypothetical protein